MNNFYNKSEERNSEVNGEAVVRRDNFDLYEFLKEEERVTASAGKSGANFRIKNTTTNGHISSN